MSQKNSAQPLFHAFLAKTQTQDGLTVCPEVAPVDLTACNRVASTYLELVEKIRRRDFPLHETMGVFLTNLLCAQFRDLGCFREASFTPPKMLARWYRESLNWLKDAQLIEERSGSYILKQELPGLSELWQGWETAKLDWLRQPSMAAKTRLVEATLQNLSRILRGETAATAIMFPDSSMALVEGVYKHNDTADLFNAILADIVVQYVTERIRLDPGAKIRILEIGAGTGGTTAIVLEKLTTFHQNIAEYCYTDISPVFLHHGEQEYKAANPFLSFRLLDVTQAIGPQGFQAGSFDLLIATNVLHATPSIRKTLQNAKALLKTNGYAVVNEISKKSIYTHLTFGLLEGWWLYEDAKLRIEGSPGLLPQSWNAAFGWEGYPAVFFPAEDYHDLGQQIVVAASDGAVRQPRAEKVVPKTKVLPEPRVQRTVVRTAVRKTRPKTSNALVSEQMRLDHVRSVIRDGIASELKVGQDKIQDQRSMSDYGVDSIIAVKLINYINAELQLNLKTTALFDYNNIENLVKHIVLEHAGHLDHLLGAAAGNEAGSEEYLEYQETVVETRLDEATPIQVPTGGGEVYHRVLISGPGTVDGIRIDTAPVPILAADEVRIAVRALSLNFGDLLCIKGLYPTMPPYPFTPGFEAAGIIVECGSNARRYQLGDAVVAVMGEDLGGQATMVVCREEQLQRKPDFLSFEEACSLPAVAITMVTAFKRAAVKAGDKVLIQTATGGTGLVAIQLAKYYGAEIFATAGSAAKIAYLRQLGVEHCINYREQDFETEVRQLTGNQGVDVVINTLGGDAIQKGIRCLNFGGRYVEIAMTAIKSAREIDMSWFNNNQSFISIDMRKLGLQAPDMYREYNAEMWRLIAQGVIRATLNSVHSIASIKEAYRELENRENIGKLVVSVEDRYVFRPEFRAVGSAIQSSGNTRYPLREPIAIVGMSGHYAHSPDVESFWTNLASGRCLVEPITRWDMASQYPKGTKFCNAGSFLDSIEDFDRMFFNISGLEAMYMDPQQRIMLEECWNALEEAGYVGEQMDGLDCGVYIGCTSGDYTNLFGQDAPPQAFWGNATSAIPSRISYFLNLQGPAIAIDTACSSSLVAMHLACQGLWNGDIPMAIAGGVFIQSTEQFYLMSERAQMLSPTGLCHTFDEQADGFVPGEGAGAVVLKRLSDAIKNGDHIHGLIRASGINQDGTTNGITAPSALSQERLEKSVYEKFQIEPESIQVVEAHGTGTPLGDPIEFQALEKAYRHFTNKRNFCALGSIKTNIGHAATAAGIASILKILMSLKYKKLAPSLHFHKPNSRIDLENSPFYINTQLEDWVAGAGAPLRGAVSSFGFSGTNAHLIIEEPPAVRSQAKPAPGYLIALSARTPQQLEKQVQRLLGALEKTDTINLSDVSYTLLICRRHFRNRLVTVVRSQAELQKFLQKWLETKSVSQVSVAELPENRLREQTSIKRYGNEQLSSIEKNPTAADYLESLTAIGELFVQGYALDYEKLFNSRQPQRLSLPTYPFERVRCWIDGPANSTALAAAKTRSETVPSFQDSLMYVPRWTELPSTSLTGAPNHQKVLLVYAESSQGFADSLDRHYRETKFAQSIIHIRLSDRTERLDQAHWTCAVDDQTGFLTCLPDLPKLDAIYFLSLSDSNQPQVDFGTIDQIQVSNELQLLRLAKILKPSGLIAGKVDFYVLTQDNYRVADNANQASGAALTGLAYAMAQGDYVLHLRNIDLSWEDLRGDHASLIGLIQSVPGSNRGELVKIAGGQCYRHNFYQLQHSTPQMANGLRQGGVYVIIGGSGAVGGVISSFLQREYSAQVVWIGRSPVDSPKIRQRIQAITEADRSPHYFQADATDRDQLAAAVQAIRDQLGTINGVIFSGLIFNVNNSIGTTSESEFLEILNVKTKGTLNCAELFAADTLDFLCFYSSGQAFSFSGAANFSAYSAGTTFSDCFVQSLQGRLPFPVGIINWGFWMAALKEKSYENIGAEALQDEEGFRCFEEFIGLLRAGALNQVISLKTNAVVRDLMRFNGQTIKVKLESVPAVSKYLLETFQAAPYLISSQTVSMLQELEAQIVRFLWVTLHRAALINLDNQGLPTVDRSRISDKYLRLTDEFIRIFTKHSDLIAHGLDAETVEHDWVTLAERVADSPDWQAQTRLLDVCIRALPKILSAEILATSVIFPKGSMELVEAIYKTQSLSDHTDSVVGEWVGAYVAERLRLDPQAIIRIIEIGAGTGSTSRKVFQNIQQHRQNLEYCYTDISQAFLNFAEKEYGSTNSYLKYQVWNIEHDTADQKIAEGYYDIVLASNVIHATKNIKLSLRHAKQAMKANGIFVINELIDKALFMSLTFGLLDGWWLYEDPQCRIPGSPLLAFPEWKRLFEEEGFHNVRTPAGNEGLLQQVIISEADSLGLYDLPANPAEAQGSRQETLKTPLSAVKKVRPATVKAATVDPKKFLKNLLQEKLSQAIKVPQESISLGVAFSEYGLDSIMGVSFVKNINEVLGLDLNSAVLFDFATIDQLSSYILENHPEARLGPGSSDDPGSDSEPTAVAADSADDPTDLAALEQLFLGEALSSEAILEMVNQR